MGFPKYQKKKKEISQNQRKTPGKTLDVENMMATTHKTHKDKLNKTHVLKAEIKETITTNKSIEGLLWLPENNRKRNLKEKKNVEKVKRICRRKKKREKGEKYMKFASEFTVGAELDVDTLVEAKSYEIQRLLHCALFFARHFSFSLQSTASLP